MTRLLWALCLALAMLPAAVGRAGEGPQHGISMYGEPALPPDFASLPYADAEAPQGGRIIFGESGGFDSLNPYILAGRAPWGVQVHVFETLMGRNWDEPFGLYGLLAESIETDESRSWVEFTLRPEAHFSDGSPVTVEDVLWSMETLATEGMPRYRNSWDKVEGWEQTGPRSVRFTFSEPDRELPLILGLRPILKKSDWEGRDFRASSLRVPVGSGPYTIGRFEPGRYIEFDRDPGYWGNDLPYNAGLHNFDRIRYEYYVDAGVLFQSFMAGELSVYRETNPLRWARQYDFPAVLSGEIVKAEIPHGRPSGMEGFVFNTRRPIFRDWRVRDALLHAFNFEFANRTLNESAYPRSPSFFGNSPLGMGEGPAEPAVRALLADYRAELPPDVFEAYTLPDAGGNSRNRANLRRASRLLAEAGWEVEDGQLRNAEGRPFRFEILLASGQNEAIANLYADALRQLGITARVRVVDQAQYNGRRAEYDYDMIVNAWALSLSPGNEQSLYWGSEGVEAPGTRNYMGVGSRAVDDLIDRLVAAETEEEMVTIVRALDRVLTTGRYVIPFWFADRSLIAHRAAFRYPERLPVYGDWTGWLPEVWWKEQSPGPG